MSAESLLFAYFHLSILTVTPSWMTEPVIEGNHVRDVVTVPSKFTFFFLTHSLKLHICWKEQPWLTVMNTMKIIDYINTPMALSPGADRLVTV